jgi:hypothetical protein
MLRIGDGEGARRLYDALLPDEEGAPRGFRIQLLNAYLEWANGDMETADAGRTRSEGSLP